MEVKLLFLTVVLLSSPLLTLCDPLFVLSAPNLLRVGSSENLLVEAQDYSGAALDVTIIVKNHPKKSREILSKSVTLTADNNFQILTDIKIPDDQNFFSDDPLEKQYVYLQAQFPSVTLEQVVMLSFHSGYIFVQTDKPIYTPASNVLYRIFSLMPNLKPLNESKITVEIMVNTYITPYCYVTHTHACFHDFSAKVDGNAFVVFGVMEDEKKTSTSLQKVQIVEGEGTAELTNQMITDTFPNINQLVGRSIYVSVSLLTESGSEMVEAERRGIQIVTSPYTIHFKKTPPFFKPGMPFSVSVYVTNPDQTPAVNVKVEVNPGGVRGQTKDNGIVKVKVNTLGGSSTLDITAKTKDPEIEDNQQAVRKMTAQAYETKGGSNNYLHIGIDAAELQIGDSMTVNLNTGQIPGVRGQDFTYMILSKGQIVKADRFKRSGESLVTLSLPVTKDMVPSFRFVAYYHVGSSEVVSDSVWVDVKDTCMGKLQLEVKEKMNTYGTGEEVKLQITGDPGAKVGLVVVDKAVQVLNKKRLTQTQIWDVIEKHDTGCTAGGGRDSMGVFTDAGLMFASHTAGGTNTRTVPECPVPAKRKRRSESLLQITSTLAGNYSGELKQCCVDGMRDNKLGYTCERRATYIIDGEECVKAFLDCCNQMITRDDDDDDDDYYTDSEDIVSRTQFPESWLWEVVDLPTSNKGCCFKSFCVSVFLLKGICVAEPEEMVVFKRFFIDLKIPYSAVRGEQLEIKVRVEFMETEDVCSSASKKGKYRTTVSVDKGSSIAVSYVIIPMMLGSHMIEVNASAFGLSDGVRKPLKVVVRLMGNSVTFWEKPLVFKSVIPTGRLPDTPADTYIAITGKEKTVEQAISGDFMGRLIVQPTGCGEQNMIYMTLPLIATHYLDSTNQWDTVGMDRRNEAVNHIRTGYQRQLVYRKSDGSYAAWRHRPSSTWLTAYVAKVFSMANNLVSIEENVICSALKWLILHKQIQDGSFKEGSAVIHGEMVGDVQGKDADASLTAFVVIAMQEAREICAESVASLQESIRKAVSFLEGRLPQLTNPYAVAMTSYAMANANKLNKDILMKSSSQLKADRSWTVPGQHHHSLEATAYAVLALVKDKDFDKAGEAVHWLNRQQSHYGGSGTTQATIMVFQAVAEYRTQVKDRQNFNLDVELSVAGRSKPVRYTIKRENAHLTRSDRVEINQEFNVTAKGTGTATLSVLTQYYARPVEKKSDCTFFDLTVKMEKDNEGKIEFLPFLWHFIHSDILIMSCIEVFVFLFSCPQLSSGKERYIQKYEKNKVLSERGSLILYLDKVLYVSKMWCLIILKSFILYMI
uniref:Complement C3-like n=1 Tax=Sinocyclocheilus grahami TaxID=75366 RepID=A0A672LWR8_SINGR